MTCSTNNSIDIINAMYQTQDINALKSAITNLFYSGPIYEGEEECLYEAIHDFLSLVPASALISAEDVIRQAYLASHDGMFGEILEEIGIAKAENAAYMNGVAYGDEPYFQPYPEEANNWEPNGVPHPNEEMRQELDELPF